MGGREHYRPWTDDERAIVKECFDLGMPDFRTAERLDRTATSIKEYRNRAGLIHTKPVKPERIFRPIPGDFREVAPGKVIETLARHYRTGKAVVLRWLAESGTERFFRPKREAGKMAARTVAKRAPVIVKRKPRKGAMVYSGPMASAAPVDGSLAAQAARHLMKDYRPVCKCITSNSKADPDLWFVGRNVLSTADMIAKAEGRGFGARRAA